MQSKFCGDFSQIGTANKFITHLVVMNYQIDPTLLVNLVANSEKIILADGGANHFYNTIKDHSQIDCIVGDFDSIDPKVLEYYKNVGVKILPVEDQDYTDCQKALSRVALGDKQGVVCIIGAAGDRIDHNIGIYSTLTKFARSLQHAEIFLINSHGLMLYLKPGKDYKIKISKFEDKKGCGVITFGKVRQIETKGLKWDMGKDQFVGSLEFGVMLSTSNQIVEEEVQIKVSDEAFWVTHVLLQK